MPVHEEIFYIKGRNRAINLFDINSSYRFFNFSCKKCKLKKHCKSIDYKQDNCFTTSVIEKILGTAISGRVSSFMSDDFYVRNVNSFVNKKIKHVIKEISNQYSK